MRKVFFIFVIIFIAGSVSISAFSQVGIAPTVEDLNVYNRRATRAKSSNQQATRSARSASVAPRVQTNQASETQTEQPTQTRSANRAARSTRSAVSSQPINVNVPSSTVSARSAVSSSNASSQSISQPQQSQASSYSNRAARRSAVSGQPAQQTSSNNTRSAGGVSSGSQIQQSSARTLGGRSAIANYGTTTAGEARSALQTTDYLTTISTETEETFVDVKECQAQYYACMDEYCDDALVDGDSMIGKCLCSNTYQNFTQRNYELETMIKRINQMIDSVAGLELKAKSGQIGGAVYQTITEEIATDLGFNFLDTSNLSDEIDYGDYASARRKEGGALYDSAHRNCQRFLQMCPKTGMNGEYMTNQYYTQIDRSCRVYDRELNTRKKEYTLKIQKLYNQYQTKEKQIALEKNKYSESECGTRLYNCMTEFCDADFSKCSTDSLMENNKVYCSSILANCENISQSVWDKFKKSIISQIKTKN